MEVLSPSTEGRDRGRKFGYYRACLTIQEYVLVDSQRQAIDIYRRKGHLWLICSFGPGEQVELTSLNVRFPVAALYENTMLPQRKMSR